jgi:hypothetical protein
VSTLGELASTPGEPAPGDGPGILVIGEVVALARLLGPAAQHPEQTPVLRAAQGGHHVGNR